MGHRPGAKLEDDLGGRMGWGTAERRCAQAAAILAALLGLGSAGAAQARDARQLSEFPDAPSALLSTSAEVQAESGTPTSAEDDGDADGQPKDQKKTRLPRCPDKDDGKAAASSSQGPPPLQGPPPCAMENQIQPIITLAPSKPLTSKEKGRLAFRDVIDPFNLVTIVGYSGVAIAANSHSAYGPGFAGWGRYTGYGFAQDIQVEFLQTYAIPSLVHQDPRYHRIPQATVKRRIWHAIEHTYVSQHDDGRPMPNYATLLTYPLSAELSDLYVPGIQTDLRSTGRRVAIGIATDPAAALTAEFLPDVAKRIHIHIVFVQEILNRMATGAPTVTTSSIQMDPAGAAGMQ
jgi:hypothetical protein